MLALVSLTGGAAREDVVSLVVLRPMSWLLLAWAILVLPERGARGSLGPLLGLGVVAITALLQLIPLPFGIWSELPGRAVVAELSAGLGMKGIARPHSLAPGETLNTFFCLAVPAATYLFMARIPQRYFPKVLKIVLVLALASALLSLLQLAGPAKGPLYFYAVTNEGAPVGFFSNRNHEAVLCAIAILLLAWWTGRSSRRLAHKADYRLMIFAMVAPLLLFLNLAGGSRLGLVLGIAALLPAGIFVMRHPSVTRFLKDARTRTVDRKRLGTILGSLAILVVAMTSFVLRSDTLDRFLVTDVTEELRAQLLPIMADMVRAYLPWGAGWGTFEHVYPVFEPTALIQGRYLNQAHNDFAQILIEGGVVGVLLIAGAFAWYAVRLLQLYRLRNAEGFADNPAVVSAAALAMLAAASVFDYPLRAPLFMAIAAIFVAILENGTRMRRPSSDAASSIGSAGDADADTA